MEPPLDETELNDHIEKSLNSLPKGSIRYTIQDTV